MRSYRFHSLSQEAANGLAAALAEDGMKAETVSPERHSLPGWGVIATWWVGLPLGIGILLCFTYIIVERFALVFSIKGGAPPLISVFVPNVLFGLFGYYLLVKAPK